jgi:hypothetical protein
MVFSPWPVLSCSRLPESQPGTALPRHGTADAGDSLPGRSAAAEARAGKKARLHAQGEAPGGLHLDVCLPFRRTLHDDTHPAVMNLLLALGDLLTTMPSVAIQNALSWGLPVSVLTLWVWAVDSGARGPWSATINSARLGRWLLERTVGGVLPVNTARRPTFPPRAHPLSLFLPPLSISLSVCICQWWSHVLGALGAFLA